MNVAFFILILLIGLLPDETTQIFLHPPPSGDGSHQSRSNFRCADAFGISMKEIPIVNQKFCALVDDEDFLFLSEYKWYWNAKGGVQTGFCILGKPRQSYMHRIITNAPKGMMVDHRNHKTWDNQKHNLRVCSNSRNQMNKLPLGNKMYSDLKGVSYHKKHGKYYAQIEINGKSRHLGSFEYQVDAARAYDKAAIALFGEFALINNAEALNQIEESEKE